MPGPSRRKPERKRPSLRLNLDQYSRRTLEAAAKLRRISVSEYIRSIAVPQAKREIEGARQNVVVLTPDEQLAFWNALQAPVKLTPAQMRLSRLARGLG